MLDASIAIVAICITLIAHLIGFVWWASRLTSRMEHVERWISNNENMSQRLIAIETKVDLILKRKDD